MKKKSVAIVVLACLLLVALIGSTACQVVQTESDDATVVSSNPQQLQILNSDYTFTQEQKTSQIKAENLIKHNGYLDSDEIVAIITLADKPLIDAYDDYSGEYSTVASYAESSVAQTQIERITTGQNSVVQALTRNNLITSVKCTYSTLLNGIAVNTTYGNLEEIKKISGVVSVILSETYNQPQATSSSSSDSYAVENIVDIYETGIYNSSSVKDQLGNQYTGKNTAVAILDSGFDCSHEVFQRVLNDDEIVITKTDVENLIADSKAENATEILNAVKYTSSATVDNLFYSNKIPFVYDYADKDVDVFPYDSEHGTHVAGIIGGTKVDGSGEDNVNFTGVAVDTQLVLMKVFPDLDSGGRTEDILLALEDAVLLGVDAINMSLGSSCGFTREVDEEEINLIYDKIESKGISLLTAASNSYSSGFGGDQGNTNFVTNPDSGTVGSPSTYNAALSVASISGVKSNYIVANKGTDDELIFFYNQSNSIDGEQNDFVKELIAAGQLSSGQSKVFEYVTIPGTGSRVNYKSVNVKGKIALVKRGDNSFEDKAKYAKENGAVACIIYNNIDGDILMSMGKSDHIPTISVSKDVGTTLAKKKTGTLVISESNLAGPFMSDFSSWGPTADLKIKPEITAHGGDIYSSVPNGKYDKLSGTSMATPNLCGIMVLIRQYLKDKYPTKTSVEINSLANQMLMSTATIALNEEGNPYSPRKQGAGLASAKNVVQTNAYITVDEEVDGVVNTKSKTKIELGDDAERTGMYVMEFNVVNISNSALTYNIDLVGMTESVSTADSEHVAEKGQLLNGTYTTEFVSGDGSVSSNKVTVQPNGQVKVKLTYTLSDADKQLIDELFKYGMYVEGFVKLSADGQIDLNVPFLAFYGDWTEAPLFDKTYYEVESQAHDDAIDDEDKLKADYWATTPYGSYYYNYVIPLGTYLYDIDTSKYDEIPASEDHIAVSNILGAIDGIYSVYAGLLRNAKAMYYTITDKVTGEVVWSYTDYNARKAYSNGGSPVPYYDFIKLKSYTQGFVNNHQYEFKMQGLLDYGDSGLQTNVRNTFSFDFYMDNEAPLLKNAEYSVVYDKTQKKNRYYVTLTVYDNHYAQSVTPIIFTSSSSYTYLTENPIPVYGERGQDATVKFEITDLLEDIGKDAIVVNALAFAVDDYALNTNIYVCQLPGTESDFKFTTNGQVEGDSMAIYTAYEGEVIDISQYLAITDKNGEIDYNVDKSYLKYLSWESSNENVVQVKDGVIKAIKSGRATITVSEQLNGRQAIIILNVKQGLRTKDEENKIGDIDSVKIKDIQFSYFDTVLAYSRSAQTSEIGTTGDRKYLQSMNGVTMYPGEKIKLSYDVQPWYAASKDNFVYSTSNANIATVSEDGTVEAISKGTAYIYIRAEKSGIQNSVAITVNSEFVIENRTLVAYKGRGGNVVIPDDEGILYIGSYAFCLYTTDSSIQLTDDDYDANKIPSYNTTITSVVVPKGVTEIQKYAFYNCRKLQEVAIPEGVKYIREFAFANCKNLERVILLDTLQKSGSTEMQQKYSLNDGKFVFNADEVAKLGTDKSVDGVPYSLVGTEVETIGKRAFYDCKKLNNVDTSLVYAMGVQAFDGCIALQAVDLTNLRNAGAQTFQHCESLKSVTFDSNGDTKLSYAMFALSGLEQVTLISKNALPSYLFARCGSLTTVNINGDCLGLGLGCFSQCDSLQQVNFNGSVASIGEQAFYKTTALKSITLPSGNVQIEAYAFYKSGIEKLVLNADTNLVVNGQAFRSSNLNNFEVNGTNSAYSVQTISADVSGVATNYNTLVKDGEIVLVSQNTTGDITIPSSITKIGASAFAGTGITSISFEGAVQIGDYAFANCKQLTSVVLSTVQGTTIGARAFNYIVENTTDTTDVSALTTVTNLDKVTKIGDYAFSNTKLTEVSIGENAIVGEGAFFRATSLTTATLGANSSYGLGAFQNCTALTTVNMPSAGGIHFGRGCFINDTSLVTIDLTKTDDFIESETFYNCTKLKKAVLTNVKTIGSYAFADCISLTDLQLPVVERIGDGAFGKYSQSGIAITSLTLPATLTKMGEGVFNCCESLVEVTINSRLNLGTAIEIVKSDDGETTTTNRLDFFDKANDVNLENGTIANYTFYLCTALKKVTIGDDIKEIGDYAFTGCSSLNQINLNGIEKVGIQSFYSCSSLASADMSNMVEVGEGAFSTTGLTSLVAPKLKKIDGYAFQQTQFTTFTATSVEEVGEGAFNENTNLTSFIFTNKIKKIDRAVFAGCTSLKHIGYTDGTTTSYSGNINSYAKVEKGVLYTKMANGNYLLSCLPANWNGYVPTSTDVSQDATNVTFTIAEGTTRVEALAGAYNQNIAVIVFPDSMRSIGLYAFYNCKNLSVVQFKSVVAPTLDDQYNANSSLAETDPGYEVLHPIYNLFGYEMYYYNFIDLAGKNKPIKMILPSNKDISGYDSPVYQAYFGKVQDATRSTYVAMEEAMINFYESAKEIDKLSYISTSNSTLIENAVLYLNKVTQDPTNYGISVTEWNSLVDIVLSASETLREIKLKDASTAAKNVQAKIDALPSKFDISQLETLKQLATEIKNLSSDERSLLSLTAYNNLLTQYTNYRNTIASEANTLKESVVNADSQGVASIGIVGLFAAAVVCKRKSK